MQSRSHKVLYIVNSGAMPASVCCFSISAGKKSMFSIKIYLGCDYHGINRQNICTIRGNPVWKQIQKCFGREAEGSFERWQDPRGITHTHRGCFWLWLSDAKIWVMDAVSLRFATSDDQGTDFSYILDDCFCTNIILARGNGCFG